MQGEVSYSAANDSLSTLAFLGQQLRQFSNSMPQQRHQNEPLGFTLSVNEQEQGQGHQNQQQQQQQQHAQSMLLNGGQASGVNRTGMFQHLHQQGSMNASLDSQQQFSNQMMNPSSSFSESLTSQVMVEQNVQGIMEHLSMLQERIQQLQALVPLIAQTAHCQTDINVVAQQQAASAAVVSIISQLAMVAIGLLPQQPLTSGVQQVNQSSELPLSQLLQAAVNPTNFFQSTILPQQRVSTSTNNVLNANILNTSPVSGVNTGVSALQRPFCNGGGHAFPVLSNETDLPQPGGGDSPAMSLHNQMTNKDFRSSKTCVASNMLSNGGSGVAANNNNSSVISELGGMDDVDNDSRVDDEDSDGENLPLGSFDLVELDVTEILAEHTHFCEICGKGFKRDANLRMHMRGHGDEYKTPAALARPDRGGGAHDAHTVPRSRRFSCPYMGCKRNKEHRKFQPLKTMLCVKNHYRRSHCPKLLMCQKCMTKKFSVVADLKTHEKHCGRDKWLCSCGTTFSRKDKLLGHIGLFQGHTPAMPMHEPEGGSLVESPTEGSFGSETKSSMRFWD